VVIAKQVVEDFINKQTPVNFNVTKYEVVFLEAMKKTYPDIVEVHHIALNEYVDEKVYMWLLVKNFLIKFFQYSLAFASVLLWVFLPIFLANKIKVV